MSELCNCPFCGGQAIVMCLDYADDCPQAVWGVFCEDDLNAEYPHGHFIDNYATEREAIEAWNRRVQC
jgi:hypothetical protein